MSRFPLNLPLVLVTLAWGYNFVSLKILYQEMPPMAVMFDRALLMGGILALICFARKLPLRYPGGADTWRILLAGFLSMGVYMVLFMRGLDLTSPAEAAIMLATAPVFTFFLSTGFRQEPWSWSALWGALVGFVGVTIVILGGAAAAGGGSLAGNLICLVSSLVWAVSVVVLRPTLSRLDATQAFTLSIPGALPVLFGFGLLPALATDYGAISGLGWLNFGQVVLVSGIVAFICFYIGINQIGPTRSTQYQFFIPPVAAMFQWLLYGRALAPLQWLGLAVLLGGVIYASRARAMAQSRNLGPEPQR